MQFPQCLHQTSERWWGRTWDNTIQYSTQHNTINLLTPLGHNWEDLWTLKEILWYGWVTRNCKVICIIVFLLWLSMHSCMASSFGCSHGYGMYAITGNSLLRYDIRPDKHLYMHSHTYVLPVYIRMTSYLPREHTKEAYSTYAINCEGTDTWCGETCARQPLWQLSLAFIEMWLHYGGRLQWRNSTVLHTQISGGIRGWEPGCAWACISYLVPQSHSNSVLQTFH